MSEVKYSNWVNVYPCQDGCGNILGPSAFDNGKMYAPCQKCGGSVSWSKPGRMKYTEEVIEKKYFFGLFTRKITIRNNLGWELKNEI